MPHQRIVNNFPERGDAPGRGRNRPCWKNCSFPAGNPVKRRPATVDADEMPVDGRPVTMLKNHPYILVALTVLPILVLASCQATPDADERVEIVDDSKVELKRMIAK